MAAHVKLRISTKEKNGSSWYSTISVGGNKYYYKFTGGNAGSNNGNQSWSAKGNPKYFDIRLIPKSDKKYRFTSDFYSFQDAYGQLTGLLNADNTVSVTNLCFAGANMMYGVYLHPFDEPHDVFLCDPRITNTLNR